MLGGVSVLDGADLAKEMRPSIGETLARQPGVSREQLRPDRLAADPARPVRRPHPRPDRRHRQPRRFGVRPRPRRRDQPADRRAHRGAARPVGIAVRLVGDRRRRQRHRPRAFRGRMPEGAVGVGRTAVATAPRPTNAPPTCRSMCRSAAISSSTPTAIGRRATICAPAAISCPGTCASRRLPAPIPEIQALADLKGELPNTRRQILGSRRRRRLMSTASSTSAFRSAATTRYTAFRSAIRSIPTSRPKRRPSTSSRPATMPAPKFRCPASSASSALRGGISDYRHHEIEDTGEIASTFFTRAARAGSSWSRPNATAGAEPAASNISPARSTSTARRNSCPTSKQRQAGLFTMQSLVRGPLAPRRRRPRRDQQALGRGRRRPRHAGGKRKFTTFSASGGASYEFSPGWRGGVTLSRSSRAPSIEELFANGPHAGTQAFEVGDPDLDPERSLSVEASMRRSTGPVQLTATAYYTHFSNFIFQTPTGEIEDDLPVFAYQQGSANFYGFEVEADAKFGNALGIDWGGELVADAVHAKIKDFGPAPQIPPLRVIGGLTGASGPVRRPDRGRACLRPEPQCAAGNRDRRLYLAQRGARLAPAGRAPGADAWPQREQSLRCGRPAAFEPAQGLCPARRPRHPADGEGRLLTNSFPACAGKE